MTKQTVIVVCPGRGTYNAAELGYLKSHHGDKTEFLSMIDGSRGDDQIAISALDGMDKFSPPTHLPGDNASLLIYACALADFADISDDYDIVGVTGNSLGWYMALAASGAVSLEDGARIVNTTGGLMHTHACGGQIVYPIVDEDWKPDTERLAAVQAVLDNPKGHITTSIRLGGMVVFAGDEAGLKHVMASLPKSGQFPFQIRYHAAFHSETMQPISDMAKAALSRGLFQSPQIPLIDGRGHIWQNGIADLGALYDYTLGHQITKTYDFTKAIEVAAKEFAPDRFIVLGPGTTLGAPVAQTLIAHNWNGLTGKAQFKISQDKSPYVISMGMDTQRTYATHD